MLVEKSSLAQSDNVYLDLSISSPGNEVAINIVHGNAVDGGAVELEALKERKLSDVKDTNLSFLTTTEQSLPRPGVAQRRGSSIMAHEF